LSFGAPTVVVLPLIQLMVPPVARTLELNGWELPPVLPPVHTLSVVVPVSVPVTVLQVILTAAQAGLLNPTAKPEIGMESAAAASRTRRIVTSFPFPGNGSVTKPPPWGPTVPALILHRGVSARSFSSPPILRNCSEETVEGNCCRQRRIL
jgi:hypothetical protein